MPTNKTEIHLGRASTTSEERTMSILNKKIAFTALDLYERGTYLKQYSLVPVILFQLDVRLCYYSNSVNKPYPSYPYYKHPTNILQISILNRLDLSRCDIQCCYSSIKYTV